MNWIKYIFISLMLLTGLFWSCEVAEIVEPEAEVGTEVVEEYPDSVYFLLSAPNPHTRVVYADEFRSEFEREDIVGCFALNADYTQADPAKYKPNARYRVAIHSNLETHEDRHFLAPLTVSDGLERDCPHYLFYYPYNEEITSLAELKVYMHEVKVEQVTRDDYEASDLLWDICEPDGEYVHVEMDHAMANVIVEVDTALIKKGNVPVLLNMPVSVPSMDLVKTSLAEMTYDVDDGRDNVRMWEFGKSVAGNYMFRAIIPACHTITSGSLILQLPDPEGGDRVHNYRCQKSFNIEPGRNYHFTVTEQPDLGDDNDVVIPPVVEDDETWIYDVLDPDTKQPVGLLCKEYLHFQPGRTYQDADQVTGTDYTTGSETSKYISSQAWVLYKYKAEGVPDLNTGYVMQFITDVRGHGDGKTSGIWPLPHKGVTDTGGGLFTPSHGHEWVSSGGGDWSGDLTASGQDSAEGKENYMHGGTITWNGSANRIEWFTMPTEKVTNAQAASQAHVAIDADGNPFLCYHEITDNAPHKIAILSPHYLVDRRVSKNRTVEERTYPLVKIGYNQFWMSLSLRSATQIDGTPLTNYNTVGSPGVTLPAYNDDLRPGYIYSNAKLGAVYGQNTTEVVDGNTYSYYDPYNQYTVEEREQHKISPLYNFMTLQGSGMLPTSAFPKATYYMPRRSDIVTMMEYLGWHSGMKIMTRGVRTREGTTGYLETEYEALRGGKYTHGGANKFGANICGFDLRAEGYFFNGGFLNVGVSGAFLLMEESTGAGDLGAYIFSLPYYLQFNNANPSGYGTDVCVKIWDTPNLGKNYATIRFFMKFAGQDDTGGISVSSLSASSLVKMKAPSSAQVENRDIYIGLDPSTMPGL